MCASGVGGAGVGTCRPASIHVKIIILCLILAHHSEQDQRFAVPSSIEVKHLHVNIVYGKWPFYFRLDWAEWNENVTFFTPTAHIHTYNNVGSFSRICTCISPLLL